MKIIDISQPIFEGMVVYPGDPPFDSRSVLSIRNGDGCEVSELTIGSHCGTHIDAPSHMLLHGNSLDKMPLSSFFGRCRVCTMPDVNITRSMLEAEDIQIGERILLKTASVGIIPHRGETLNPSAIDQSAAEYLAEKQTTLIGIDAPSIENMEKSDGDVHRILLEAGVAILEGLELSHVEDGIYTLSALPLNLFGENGSPCRAVLICE